MYFLNFDFGHNTASPATGSEIAANLKHWSSFLHPMDGPCNYSLEMEYQTQIGSKMFPDYHVRSINQAFL